MRDPMLALDLDLAIATRARMDAREQLDQILGQEDGAYESAVVYLLQQLLS